MPRTSCHAFVVAIVGLAGAGCAFEEPDGENVSVGTQEIAGGGPTPAGMFPAVGDLSGCSGSLIADRLVLTAGHCVCSAPDPGLGCPGLFNEVFILKGVDDFTTPEDETLDPDGIVFNGTPFVHPDYEAGGWYEDAIIDNDYAVIVLNQSVSSRVAVTPMSISTSSFANGTLMTLVGFGGRHPQFPDADECDMDPGIKRHASTILDDSDDHGKYGLDLFFADNTVHSCKGDSGGPAVDPYGRIAGVASSGNLDSESVYDGTYKAREWIQQQIISPGNRVRIWGFETSPAPGWYFDNDRDPGMFGWNDTEDLRLAGDFLGLGYDQVLYINRGSGVGRFQITDQIDGIAPVETLFLAGYSVSGAYNEFLNSTADRQVVGDFLGLGHDQVMFINTGGSGGRVAIADFAVGVAPVFFESYSSQNPLLNGWHDSNDKILVGDFRANGHDQVMFINRGVGAGRVLIVDFDLSPAPATWDDVPYYEAYSQSVTLNGWHDGNNDFVVAADLMGQGFDQVLFVNGDGAGGRMMVVDFRGTAPTDWPSDIWYYEGYGWSPMFNFWHDADDALLAGDFMGEGFDQLLLVNRGPGGRFLVADFRGGYPADNRFIQLQGQDPQLETRIDWDDGLLIGDFVAQNRSQLLTIERF